MKETKKIEEASATRARAVRSAWVERNRICGESRQTLLQLEGWLSEHSKALEQRFTLCGQRFPKDGVGRLVRQGSTAFLVENAITLAEQLLAGRNLTEIVLHQQELMKPFYSRIKFSDGGPTDANPIQPEYLILFKQWDFERAAVLILAEAIKIQKQAVVAKTTISMEKFSRDTAEIRSSTARDFLAALNELRCAVEPDQRLVEGLEPEEIACLSPKPFPSRVLSSEVLGWIADAVDQKMITSAEIAGLLQLETVHSAEPAPAPAPEESRKFLQCQV